MFIDFKLHSDQMVLGNVRWEAGPREWQPKAKSKLAQVGPSGSSPLRLFGSCDAGSEVGPCERWPKMLEGKIGK